MGWERRPVESRRSKRLLADKDFRTKIRDQYKQDNRSCARCGGSIDYDGTYYIQGTKRKNPRYLHVGHIVDRDKAILLGWTDEEINDESNLQPECSSCSDKSGARYGRSKQGLTVVHSPVVLDTSREW
jgi:5-methylcytosine-specific restriction endonuclease McrA